MHSPSPTRVLALVRSVLTCLLVAGLSYWIQGMETARGLPGLEPDYGESSNSLEWIRTRDGWEHSSVLQPQPGGRGLLHPLVVAGLQLLGSLLVLLAFPRSSRPSTYKQMACFGRLADGSLALGPRQTFETKPVSPKIFSEFCTKWRPNSH